MSKRLQVLLDEAELADFQQAAERRGLTLSAWVRDALRESRRKEPARSKEAKLAAIREASAHAFPTADIGAMLEQIERGRSGEE